MAEIKLTGLQKKFHNKTVLADFSLDLPEKAFVVLAGPSGCGKTTLLKIIAGLLKATHGKVEINGQDVSEALPGERGIAMVFQEAALFPHLSAYDNIIYGLSETGMSKEEIRDSAMSIANLIGIEKLLSQKADTLSGGEKQRVSIARALVRKPALFLMDEPLSALDARLRNQLRMELLRLYQEATATFLYVTHDQSEAMSLADVLVIMKEGNIMQKGTPKEIYDDPKNRFTAEFLGRYKINEFRGHIQEHKLYVLDRRSPLILEKDNQEVIIAVRETAIMEDDEGWEGTLMMKEDMGDVCYYHIAFQGTTIFMKERVKKHYQIGDSIHFSFHWRDVFLFDVVSGNRIYLPTDQS